MAVTTSIFVVTSLAITLPWVYSLRRSSLSWPTVVSFLLLIHSLMGLHTILVRPPLNVFATLQIPLNTPTDAIRALLLRHSDAPELSEELERLLQRFASFDVRSLYPRFGHNVLTTCTYCQSFEDFALYALPRPILSYIREIAFVGLITSHRRKIAVTALILMGFAEVYMLLTTNIIIPPRGDNQPVIMLHDILLTIRHAAFIIIPLLTYFLPPIHFRIPFLSGPTTPNPPIDTTALLMQTHQTLSHILPTVHLLKYAHAATMRVPSLRARASSWWEEEARVGTWVKEDGKNSDEGVASVQNVARSLGVSFDDEREGQEEGKLRTSAKMATRTLISDGLKVSDHWKIAP